MYNLLERAVQHHIERERLYQRATYIERKSVAVTAFKDQIHRHIYKESTEAPHKLVELKQTRKREREREHCSTT
jgi:hypothetical protein